MILRDIHHPCGRLLATNKWKRDRSASLKLRDHELWLVIQGTAWMSDGHQERTLGPGSCVWMRPGGIYDAQHDQSQPFRLAYIHFAPVANLTPPEYFLVDPLYFGRVMQRIIELIPWQTRDRWGESADPPPAAMHLLAGLLEDLLHLGPNEPGLDQHALDAPLHQLAQRLWDDPATAPPVADLARSVHLSPPHFCRRFRAALGMSPQQWVIEARLYRARVLLKETALSMAQIAEDLGYCDPYAFSKQFKRFVGITPTAYRKQ